MSKLSKYRGTVRRQRDRLKMSMAIGAITGNAGRGAGAIVGGRYTPAKRLGKNIPLTWGGVAAAVATIAEAAIQPATLGPILGPTVAFVVGVPQGMGYTDGAMYGLALRAKAATEKD